MKTLRDLATLQSQKDSEELARLALFILKHRGSFSQAMKAADDGKLQNVLGLTPRLIEILRKSKGGGEISRATMSKAAQSSIGISGSPFQNVSAISSAFVASLQSWGCFDALLGDMAHVPMLQSGTVGAVVVSAASYNVLEGQMKPISRLSLTGTLATPTKVHTALIISQELARMSDAVRLIQVELRNSVAVASDSAFITAIIAGVIPATSFGTSASNARADIEYLLRVTNIKQTSRPYLVTTPAIARTLSEKDNTLGEAAFPMLGPQGGLVSPGLPLLVSDAVPVGYLICIDASRIAANGGEVVLSEIEEAVMQMDDAPDSPPTGTTNLQSLWQMNLTGIRLERWMLAQKLTSSAVAIINNPNSYVVGAGSP
jgi:hypothetical protein